MTSTRTFMHHEAIIDIIDGMGHMLRRYLDDHGIQDPAVIGIHSGGVWVAEHLHKILGSDLPLGYLDISFYRDDFTRIGMNPKVRPSQIDFDVEGRHIILVDDVIESGRTIRASMNEIFDFGRPASITLACLIERGGRELPIQPDVMGLRPPLQKHEHIKLSGPQPLTLEIHDEKRQHSN